MNDKDFNNLVTGLKQSVAIHKGELKPSREFEYSAEEVKKIRDKFHQTQKEFADTTGVSVKTLQNWEQGRRTPNGSARTLLKIAKKNPKILAEAF